MPAGGELGATSSVVASPSDRLHLTILIKDIAAAVGAPSSNQQR
jgi:hypothetical protein